MPLKQSFLDEVILPLGELNLSDTQINASAALQSFEICFVLQWFYFLYIKESIMETKHKRQVQVRRKNKLNQKSNNSEQHCHYYCSIFIGIPYSFWAEWWHLKPLWINNQKQWWVVIINRISSSTVITIVIIKVTMKQENKKQISIKTYLVWTVQHHVYVCARV